MKLEKKDLYYLIAIIGVILLFTCNGKNPYLNKPTIVYKDIIGREVIVPVPDLVSRKELKALKDSLKLNKKTQGVLRIKSETIVEKSTTVITKIDTFNNYIDTNYRAVFNNKWYNVEVDINSKKAFMRASFTSSNILEFYQPKSFWRPKDVEVTLRNENPNSTNKVEYYQAPVHAPIFDYGLGIGPGYDFISKKPTLSAGLFVIYSLKKKKKFKRTKDESYN